jgi:hypothetical protein
LSPFMDQSGNGAVDLIRRNDFRCAREDPERIGN